MCEVVMLLVHSWSLSEVSKMNVRNHFLDEFYFK